MDQPRRKRPSAWARRAMSGAGLVIILTVAGGADGTTGALVEMVTRQAEQIGRQAIHQAQGWYVRTPPMERITWGGLVACGALGLLTALERSWRVRRGRVIPSAFVERFQRRLAAGHLDRGKALDYCELNTSPAARVALAAIQRWGRPASDLERGTVLASQREVDQLRRHVDTLRRVAALAPLIGLLGTLTAATRLLSAVEPGMAWGPALASALGPLTIGVGLAILALVLYDGLTGRVETLTSELDRVGAETVDAIAMHASAPARESRVTRPDPGMPSPSTPTPHGSAPAIRIPVRKSNEC